MVFVGECGLYLFRLVLCLILWLVGAYGLCTCCFSFVFRAVVLGLGLSWFGKLVFSKVCSFFGVLLG